MAKNLNPPPQKILFKNESISLVIRPLEESDAACIHQAVEESKEILIPFLDWAHKNWTLKKQAARLRKTQNNYYRGKEYEFGVFSLTENQFLMAASWTPGTTQNKKSLGIGYWTHIDQCGRGLATLVTQILIICAFDFMKCDRTEIRCKKGNSASQKVIEKCGFRFEGESRNYFPKPTKTMIAKGFNPDRDCLQYALVPEDIKDLAWYAPIRKKMNIVSNENED